MASTPRAAARGAAQGSVPCHNRRVNKSSAPPLDDTPEPAKLRWWRPQPAALGLFGLLGLGLLTAQVGVAAPVAQAVGPGPASTAEEVAEPSRSALDALLFYQVLIGEIELRQGQAAVAFEVVLDAARRNRNEQLFRRATDIALQARAGDKALLAVRTWRQALPESLEAVRLQLQIVGALNRPQDAAEPLRFLLSRTGEAERSALIASIPRFFRQAVDPQAVAAMLEPVLQIHLKSQATRAAARLALGRVWLQAGDTERALTLVRQAHELDVAAVGPVLAALDLMPRAAAAEALVRSYLRTPQAEPAVRLAYARALVQAQRLGDAVAELELVTQQQPALSPPWLMLGALQVELKHPQKAEPALQRYLELVALAQPTAASAAGRDADARPGTDDDDDGPDSPAGAAEDGIAQARMLLAQAAELRRDDAAAEVHLAKIDQPKRLLEVQTRRAGILARQGRVEQARDLLRKLPERTESDARAKLTAEAQVMRDVKRWADAYTVLEQAAARWPRDVDLLYEQAMVAEKMGRLADMETLLRRVIEIKPDHQHAYNALGYSLADRGLRLEEARALIVQALTLAPGDPFITDSLGWVEFRLGRHEEALRLLREAYRARPDTEIAAHLGEVMWVMGRHEEARQVWREGRARDAANEVLRETLARLQQDL